MSDAETMRALIERVKQASGPDRELDALIWCGLKGYRLTGHAYGKWTYYVPDAACEGKTADIPGYTGSLDAAVSLVPEGWGLCFVIPSRLGYCTKLTRQSDGHEAYGRALTEQGARVAAALRAQAAEGERDG